MKSASVLTTTAAETSREAGAAKADARATTLAVAFVAIVYLASAILVAHSRSLWMDEVLAVWAARLPSARDVVGAIWKGAEFSPPTYDLLLHAVFRAFGSGALAARMPSILAVLLAAAMMARIVTKALDAQLGALVFALVLSSGLFGYAVQARPYAIMIALHAVALMIWSEYPDEERRPWRALAITALLFAGVSMHVYGIVGIAVFALMEALRSIAVRRIRWLLWAAFSLAGIASLAWWPLVRHLSRFNSTDAQAPEFYAKPTMDAFGRAVINLGIPHLLVLALLAASIAALVVTMIGSRARETRRRPAPVAIKCMMAALLAALPIAFGLSAFVTHAFSDRYALEATLGIVLGAAMIFRYVPFHRSIALGVMGVACLVMVYDIRVPDETRDAIDLIASDPSHGPLVIGEGYMYLPLMEGAPPAVRSRFVFLTTPPGIVSEDPTNEHQILRFQTILGDLPVKDPSTFFAHHPTFEMLVRSRSTEDTIRRWVHRRKWPTTVAVQGPAGAIVTVEVEPPHDDPPATPR